jgi:hypothetical protein
VGVCVSYENVGGGGFLCVYVKCEGRGRKGVRCLRAMERVRVCL